MTIDYFQLSESSVSVLGQSNFQLSVFLKLLRKWMKLPRDAALICHNRLAMS